MYDKNACSPISKSKSDIKMSCLNEDIIKKIGKSLNIKSNNNIEILYDKISKKIKNISECDNEICWIKINKIINYLSKDDISIFKDMFKPMMPNSWRKNNNEWLNTFDIEKVLNQYTKATPSFYFYGAMPSDYYNNTVCDIYKLCKINIKKHIKNKIKKIGIVFNTDESDMPGSHWVSIYIDLMGINSGHPSIYYFDSVGNKPPDNIQKLINSVRKQKKLNYYYNDISHQEKNTECGVYCLHFITYMIQNGKFDKYIKNKKSDNYMYKYRNFFFNKI
jgi:hypothetical protein